MLKNTYSVILLHTFQKQVKLICVVKSQEISYLCWGLRKVFGMRSEAAFWGASYVLSVSCFGYWFHACENLLNLYAFLYSCYTSKERVYKKY